jgi:hypothetical protein
MLHICTINVHVFDKHLHSQQQQQQQKVQL